MPKLKTPNAPSVGETSLKEIFPKAKSQNDSTANSKKLQTRPVKASPDAWRRLIGPHNIALMRLNSLETMASLDTGAQISSISKLWVEDSGLPLYEVENIVDIE